MIYQVGKKQCSNSGRKRNDIAPLESDFMVQPPSLLEFPGPLTPPPPWNFQFPPWWGSGYFLEPHIVRTMYYLISYQNVLTLFITFSVDIRSNKKSHTCKQRLIIHDKHWAIQQPVVMFLVLFSNCGIQKICNLYLQLNQHLLFW